MLYQRHQQQQNRKSRIFLFFATVSSQRCVCVQKTHVFQSNDVVGGSARVTHKHLLESPHNKASKPAGS